VRDVQRLVVRAPNWLGDAVLSLAAVRDLRNNFPAARIEVLARPWVGALYGAVPEIDAVRESWGVRHDGQALHGQFDAAALLTNSFATALAVWLAGTPERWGYATDGRSPLLTRSPRVPREVRGVSEVYYHRAMLAGVGLRVSAEPDNHLAPPPAWRGKGMARLGDGGEWIGLNPGAAYGSAKRWLPERYAAVGDRLARSTGARVAILGGPAERPLAEWIAGSMTTPARVLAGETTLPELIGLIQALRLLVTNDSGPMHIAAALGTPVVALFGPTDWTETAPVGSRHRLLREPVECAPCKLRECPIDHRCMRLLDVDRVVDASRELLGEVS
jgi:heptosyltransferase-2